MAGTGTAPLYDDPVVPVIATGDFLGTREGAPVAWAIIQVAKGSKAKAVRVRFADGSTDTMKPKRGIAVLVHPASARQLSSERIGFAQALDGKGKVLAGSEVIPAPEPESASNDLLGRPECKPVPPGLPEPTGPPPADEPQARAAVVETVMIVGTGSTPDEQKFARIDDPHGIDQALAVARRNYPQALANVTTRINEVRFLNPTEAAIAYDIVIPNYSVPEFPGRQGRVVLLDGSWKVTRATFCRDLQLAGAPCPS